MSRRDPPERPDQQQMLSSIFLKLSLPTTLQCLSASLHKSSTTPNIKAESLGNLSVHREWQGVRGNAARKIVKHYSHPIPFSESHLQLAHMLANPSKVVTVTTTKNTTWL